MLLHGDLNPFNVLAAEREPWLAIDCKPVVDDFARPLDLDPRRAAGWAFVKSLGWTWSPAMVAVFRHVWDQANG